MTAAKASKADETVGAAILPASSPTVKPDLVAYARFIVGSLGLSISRGKIAEVLARAASTVGAGLRQQGLAENANPGDTRDERSEPWWPPWK